MTLFPKQLSSSRTARRAVAVRTAAGITLVEMLVVISVVVLLLALLLPSMKQAQYSVRLASCAGNLRQIAMATVTYGFDNNKWYPGAGKNGYEHGVMGRTTEVPPGLAEYTGGSISARDSELWRCPEAYARTAKLGENPDRFSYYPIYYNKISSLYSGQNPITYSNEYRTPIPNRPHEAMRRVGDERYMSQWNFSGNQVGGWKSRIIASDVSHASNAGRYEAGHMIGGEFSRAPYSVLRWGTRDSRMQMIANYAFDDGGVRRYTFTTAELRETMSHTRGGPMDWDIHLQPREWLTPIPK